MEDPELAKRIEEICKKLGIAVHSAKSGRNCANRKTSAIWIRAIADAGDFAAALHEIGHVLNDPENPPHDHRERLDAEANAWQWALDHESGDFDLPAWIRLHSSLHEYYVAVMDPAHPAHTLLVEAEKRDATIRPRVSSFGVPRLTLGSRKQVKPER
jgi:hypothetical protein